MKFSIKRKRMNLRNKKLEIRDFLLKRRRENPMEIGWMTAIAVYSFNGLGI